MKILGVSAGHSERVPLLFSILIVSVQSEKFCFLEQSTGFPKKHLYLLIGCISLLRLANFFERLPEERSTGMTTSEQRTVSTLALIAVFFSKWAREDISG